MGPYHLSSTTSLLRLVGAHGLRQPALDLADPGLLRRVSGEELRRSGSAFRGLGHPDPEIARRVGIVAGLGHVDQPQVIGLGFLLASPRQEQRVHEEPGSGLRYLWIEADGRSD